MLVAQSCPTVCSPMDWVAACQAPLSMEFSRQEDWEWVAIPFARGSSQPRDWTWVSSIAGRCFILWATREAHSLNQLLQGLCHSQLPVSCCDPPTDNVLLLLAPFLKFFRQVLFCPDLDLWHSFCINPNFSPGWFLCTCLVHKSWSQRCLLWLSHLKKALPLHSTKVFCSFGSWD